MKITLYEKVFHYWNSDGTVVFCASGVREWFPKTKNARVVTLEIRDKPFDHAKKFIRMGTRVERKRESFFICRDTRDTIGHLVPKVFYCQIKPTD